MSRTQALTVCDDQGSGWLEVTWADQHISRLPHRWLREHCRCAACRQRQRTGTLADALPAHLRLSEIHTVGEQGLNLVFSDGHGRGIYPWPYLRELGDTMSDDPRRGRFGGGAVERATDERGPVGK